MMTERANTMKTYILRDPKAVEPQKASRATRPLRAKLITAPAPIGPVLFSGLDVHNDTIAVSLAPGDSTEVRRYGIIGGEHDDVLRLIKKLSAAHPGVILKFCYEAGPRGYPLCRFIRSHGVECIIVAPSKVPRQPGDRVKTDRRDADQLARLYRAGELTGIYVPDPQDEAVRDLIRARYQVQKQQHRARQQLKMFLLRQNIRYAGYRFHRRVAERICLFSNTSAKNALVFEPYKRFFDPFFARKRIAFYLPPYGAKSLNKRQISASPVFTSSLYFTPVTVFNRFTTDQVDRGTRPQKI